MKKLFALTIIFSVFLLLTGCEQPATDDSDTTLTINNLSDYNLLNVEYAGVEFGSIDSGKDITKKVNPGSKYIYFVLQIVNTGVRFRLDAIITCAENKKTEINIINNTVVITTVDERKETLKSLFGTLTSEMNQTQIGGTGPGGGMIFYAQGGQYKECSAELGTYIWNDAITAAKNYRGGEFDNWHLPDRGELDLMYWNLHKNGLGGFLNNYYWSSTRDGNTATSRAYYQNFSNGMQSSYNGDYNSYRTRAVREYTIDVKGE